jgi:hypothetical protein
MRWSVGASRSFFLPPDCSFWLSGVLGDEVDGARDNSSRGCFTTWLYMAAKPSHVGVDVDGLACPLHWPTVHSCQTRGQSLSARCCLVLLLHWAVVHFGDVKLLLRRCLMES